MIQYFHCKYAQDVQPWMGHDRYTVAVEVPLKNDLLDLFAFGNKILKIDVGMSKVHPHDQYSKSIGREISKSKMKATSFQFKVAQFPDDDTIHLYLYSETNELIFRIHNKSEKVYLLSALQR